MTFYELEKACKKRRFKKKIFFLVFIIFLLVILYLIYKFFISNNFSPKTFKNKNIKIIKHHKLREYNDTNNTQIIKNNNQNNSIVLAPVISLNFKDINTSNPKKTTKKEEKIKKIPKQPKKQQKANIITTEILPSYNECIYQAKLALKNKNYSLALKWAKNANIQNKIKPESWIISAEVLYKLGKKQKAINILKLYLKYNKNQKVEKFLKELENEK